MTVRVALNGYFLAEPYTGSGRYTTQLLAGLTRHPDIEPVVLGPRGAPTPARPVATPLDPFGPDLTKIWLEAVGLAAAARRQGTRLLHYPYLAGSLAGAPPTVVTAHDAIPFVLPEYRRSPKVRLYNVLVARAVRQARLVLTDSVASRDDLVRVLGLAPERTRVIYLAADPSFTPVDDEAERAATRARYGLPDRCLLYLGSVELRKHVLGMLEAYALARRMGLDVPLVLASRIPPPGGLFPDVRAAIASLGIEADVVLCGPGRSEDTPRLLRAATAFVFPSCYEGFGLPPLEAMACGTPVVCSNRSSLPEVVGDAALLFDPMQPEQMADAMRRIIADADLRRELRERGLAQASRFTWESTVAQTVAAYREAAGA